ncbi:PBECR4 domain-containing protein, partial [Streptococcus suis]
ATQTLEDFANGKGDFDSILIANKGAAFDKIKVLPELEAIIQSDSFYFGDLSEVPKLKQLDMDKAIRSGDEDVVLAMRTVDGTTFPASLLKLRQTLALQLEDSTEERTILGVYRYRDSQL